MPPPHYHPAPTLPTSKTPLTHHPHCIYFISDYYFRFIIIDYSRQDSDPHSLPSSCSSLWFCFWFHGWYHGVTCLHVCRGWWVVLFMTFSTFFYLPPPFPYPTLPPFPSTPATTTTSPTNYHQAWTFTQMNSLSFLLCGIIITPWTRGGHVAVLFYSEPILYSSSTSPSHCILLFLSPSPISFLLYLSTSGSSFFFSCAFVHCWFVLVGVERWHCGC